MRREVFGVNVSSPTIGNAVEGARRCLRKAGCLDAASAIPDHGGRNNVDWPRFELDAGFDLIERELREAYAIKKRLRELMDQPAVTQVFSPHELLDRPRSLMRSALPDRCSRSRSALRLEHPAWSGPSRLARAPRENDHEK